ncbi:[nife]-hydrogenase small subunit [Lucifera butyrica]|uniref:[nife]-hydrogenase small subunit n=1 Tax=Lucifera butyrica TaxID=1351585 RepID=A0A498R702_9FIRM|nr:hydrogenase small subunit [Lucifera butyrica]VBB05943.1 [nife]-hydrogenase small subunit [Lucifera butyrica]
MLTRRKFIELCMSSALTVSLTDILVPFIRQALAEEKLVKPPVITLELGSCTGESISLRNAVNPTFTQVLDDMLDFRYNWLMNSCQGDLAVKTLSETVEQETGRFWLIVEGAVMTADNGRYNEIFLRNGRAVTGLAALQEFAPKAKYIIAVGDCACFGGPAAAHPNPGGAKGVWDAVSRKVINIPGCPSHPDWMIGTFTHLLFYGLPELDAYNRPKLFFGKTIHELCSRRQQFEDGIFAAFPGDNGCFYKVGCKGPVTHADCPTRQWNHGVNWPVKAGIPCIGCANPRFPDASMPFFNHLPDYSTRRVTFNIQKVGTLLAALSVGAVGTHWAASVYARRIHKHFLDGVKPASPAPPENLEQLKQELDDLIRRQNALLAENKKLEQAHTHRRRKSWLRRIRDFWRTEDKKGKE